jgi:hypothetical protein
VRTFQEPKGDNMADKKVDRSSSRRPLTPTQKMTAALSDPGTMDMANPTHDKGRSALVDKFRDREDRWRREQAQHEREASQQETTRQAPQEADAGEPEGGGEGGAS